ncbi:MULTISPECIES: ABC transporter permease DevC [Planktothricoides]|uniref:ABC transporter permease DevC n=2 Tax=Planktothricoides raciborskii TaxID=132608 RepID=A0AAU8JES5_9CYAN|nr:MULTISPECIES: ABC transporter permease DevC [Planktothricoides]KOR35835.1 ABC transporter [Planktothricoides sp. SR001]MBD2544241.1 FtsX-like permease family protein [Planktothricoides raciborskii FACHB-1370]MBD2583593.1 FtsX-like permease family protein [Planktothricoides raciborskii FACHB-1261]
MFRKIPLAWLQLTREKSRLGAALAGIVFADILMFMQLGFREALFNSNTRMHRNLNADLVMISRKSESLISIQKFSHRRLYQTLGFSEVESVAPLYVGQLKWKNPFNRKDRIILIFGTKPSKPAFLMPEVADNSHLIQLPYVVLFDRMSRREFGEVAQAIDQGKSVTTEVGVRRIEVKGLFSLGASFAADGNLITSDLNFIRLFPNRRLGEIDIGLIRLKPNSNPTVSLEKIRQYLPSDVQVFTKQGYLDYEKSYWEKRTAIGFVFRFGVIMGFIVGLVIVYQIIYTDVADHLAEYATLKAMGYQEIYFYSLVIQEALLLAILGYIPGIVCSLFLYKMARSATMLPILMTLPRVVTVLGLTIFMCAVSGAIAMRKLQEADPADIF